MLPDANSTGCVDIVNLESPNESISEPNRFSAPVVYLNDEDPKYKIYD